MAGSRAEPWKAFDICFHETPLFPPDLHPAYPALTALFAAAEPAFRAVLAAAGGNAAEFARILRGGPGLGGDGLH